MTEGWLTGLDESYIGRREENQEVVHAGSLKSRFGNGKGVATFTAMSFQLGKKIAESVEHFARID